MRQRKGAVTQQTVQEGERLYNVWEQPDRGEILEVNRERQGSNPRKTDWIKPLASIPTLDQELLKQSRYREIFQDRRKMERFVNSSEGRPYRTTPRGRSRNFSFGGI